MDIELRRKEIWSEEGLNPDCYSNAVGQAMNAYAKEWARQDSMEFSKWIVDEGWAYVNTRKNNVYMNGSAAHFTNLILTVGKTREELYDLFINRNFKSA